MKLNIKNFKCFEDQEIAFSNLTVLAGNNGAGKSTVIQAFLLIAQTFDKESYTPNLKRLYLNDYFCELGSSQRLRYKEANSDEIEFKFTNNNGDYTKLIGLVDKKDFNILNVNTEINNDNHTLDFINYFDFIGADRFGPKIFNKTDSNFSRIRVGKYGEYSTIVLDKYKNEFLDITLPNANEDEKSTLLTQVNYWMSEIFNFIKIDTEYIEKANVAMLKIKNKLSGDYESPVNMPYGVSYVLPIIVSVLVRQISKDKIFDDYKSSDSEKDIVIIENPEAHLHPSAQSRLGLFLAQMSKNMNIVLETHSEHIINGIRIAIKHNKVDVNNVLFNFFEHGDKVGQNTVKPITINRDGNLSAWPEGFFDQYENDLMDLM
jgi:predicted ATPase